VKNAGLKIDKTGLIQKLAVLPILVDFQSTSRSIDIGYSK